MNIKVLIIESEKGWGQRIDEVKVFSTNEEADTFIKQYNSENNASKVPDWYMYAKLASEA